MCVCAHTQRAIYLKKGRWRCQHHRFSCSISSSSADAHRFWSSSFAIHSGDTSVVLYDVTARARTGRLREVSIDLGEVGGLEPP